VFGIVGLVKARQTGLLQNGSAPHGKFQVPTNSS
jgi:hypothetical protein